MKLFLLSCLIYFTFGSLTSEINEISDYVHSEYNTKYKKNFVIIEIDICREDPQIAQQNCLDQQAMTTLDEINWFRIVYADFNRTGPCIVGFRNREKNETKFEYIPEPIIGDFELLKESEVSFEDSFVFMNKIFKNFTFLAINYRSPVYPCVTEPLYMYNRSPEQGVGITSVGGYTGNVCDGTQTQNITTQPVCVGRTPKCYNWRN